MPVGGIIKRNIEKNTNLSFCQYSMYRANYTFNEHLNNLTIFGDISFTIYLFVNHCI